jgi:hypothetical protein
MDSIVQIVAMSSLISGRFNIQTHGVPMPVWLGARLAALVLVACLVWALLSLEPLQIAREPPVIVGVTISQIETLPPVPILQTKPLPDAPTAPLPKPSLRQPVPKPLPKAPSPQQAQIVPIPQDRSTPQRVPANASLAPTPSTAPSATSNAGAPSSPSSTPRLATTPSGSGSSSKGATTGTATTGSGSGPPTLRGGTLAILRARECARLDIKDRPADCPPNEELARLLAQERAPQYRPENAEGFSRNELAWRGIPPPCLDDGENSAIKGGKLCVRFGNTPSRVRSPREICEARGLGGCQDLPGQAAVNAAVEQVRRQESAKAKRP